MSDHIKHVLLAAIAFDAGTQVRAAINEDVVAQYAHGMEHGDTFPPIVLFHDGSAHYLADGFHRVMAAKRNDWQSISADVRAGTKTDALWFALGANKANGQRLTSADKKHAIELAFLSFPDMSNNLIADQVGCSQSYVQKLKQVPTSGNLPDRVTGKDGKSYPASRGPHPKTAEIEAALRAGGKIQEIATQFHLAPKLVTQIAKAAGIQRGADKSRAAVNQRKKDVQEMATRGFSSRQIASHLSIDEGTVKAIAKHASIVIHADRVAGGTQRHNANRILDQMVMDAENLTADVGLIEFGALDQGKLGAWIESLKQSQKSLSEFVKRLMREQGKHGQAA